MKYKQGTRNAQIPKQEKYFKTRKLKNTTENLATIE